jgi:DNA-binding MarR family transcriptional regulator
MTVTKETALKPSSVEEFKRQNRSRIPKVSNPIDFSGHLPSRIVVLANGLGLHAYRRYSRDLGLRTGDWRIIASLGYLGPISYNDLASRIGMDRAGISRTIAALVRRDYIERHIDLADKRQSILMLTKKGVAAYNQLKPIARVREARLLAVLTGAERRALDRILKKLQDEVDRMLNETPR